MALLFYRSRAVSHSTWADSDLVVFALPLIAGFAVFGCVLFCGLPKSVAKRRTAVLGLSAFGAVLSSLVGTVIAFNLYRT